MRFTVGNVLRRFAWLPVAAMAFLPIAAWADDSGDPVDTALIVSVDVSGSVNTERYQLQMQGIAKALEDPSVLGAIQGGPHGGILFAMIAWADKPHLVVDWQRIGSRDDALAIAARIRTLPQQGGDFTCFRPMFETIAEDVIPSMPAKAMRIVVDVSGDGIDNCTPPAELAEFHRAVLAHGATINGLPILVPGENDTVGVGSFRAPGYGMGNLSSDPHEPTSDMTTLPAWYGKHVLGGRNAFLMPAEGYGDFARALRRKFVIEISGLPAPAMAARR